MQNWANHLLFSYNNFPLLSPIALSEFRPTVCICNEKQRSPQRGLSLPAVPCESPIPFKHHCRHIKHRGDERERERRAQLCMKLQQIKSTIFLLLPKIASFCPPAQSRCVGLWERYGEMQKAVSPPPPLSPNITGSSAVLYGTQILFVFQMIVNRAGMMCGFRWMDCKRWTFSARLMRNRTCKTCPQLHMSEWNIKDCGTDLCFFYLKLIFLFILHPTATVLSFNKEYPFLFDIYIFKAFQLAQFGCLKCIKTHWSFTSL